MTFFTANDAFKMYYDYISEQGIEYSNTKAVFNELIHIAQPLNNNISTPFRNWSQDYVIEEWKWYLSGSRNVHKIKKIAPIWDKMHKGDNMVWSNYGWWWRIGKQLDHIIADLKQNPTTRRAIIVHYNPNLVDEFDKDTPCNLVLNFFIVGGLLNLTVMARSIDLWYGFCNDQWIFSELLRQVGKAVNYEIGSMTYFITNLHLYKNKLNKKR